LRHDARSLRKVLHMKAVTNIAVLEEFGIFLVLQDKVSSERLRQDFAQLEDFASLSSRSTRPDRIIPSSPGRTTTSQSRQRHRVFHSRSTIGTHTRPLHEAKRHGLALPCTRANFGEKHRRSKSTETAVWKPAWTTYRMVPPVQGLLHPDGSAWCPFPQAQIGCGLLEGVRDYGSHRVCQFT